jgi:thioesterase domain-containing protein
VGLFDTAGPSLRHRGTTGGGKRAKAKIHWQNLSQGGWPYLREKLGNVKRRQQSHWQLNWQLRWHHWQGKTLSYELHYQRLLQENRQALRRYTYPAYNGHLVIFRATEEVFYDANYLTAGLGWRSRVETLTMHDVPGNHTSVTDEPNVQVLAQFMRQYLPQPSTATNTPTESIVINSRNTYHQTA